VLEYWSDGVLEYRSDGMKDIGSKLKAQGKGAKIETSNHK
jgi:hypothetical protein